jgi:hypothetical protein
MADPLFLSPCRREEPIKSQHWASSGSWWLSSCHLGKEAQPNVGASGVKGARDLGELRPAKQKDPNNINIDKPAPHNADAGSVGFFLGLRPVRGRAEKGRHLIGLAATRFTVSIIASS